MRRLTGWDRVLGNASRMLADATRMRAQMTPAAGPDRAVRQQLADRDVADGVTGDERSELPGLPAAGIPDRGTASFVPEGLPDEVPEGMPAADQPMSPAEQQHAAGLMRVNHVGEVCAQALYQGQAATAGTEDLRGYLLGAADEEKRHLDWTSQRIAELGGRPSRLVPFWYASSYLIGAAAGLRGDKASLGFMAETERQVEAHLAGHLKSLPPADARSRAIVRKMQAEEAGHAEGALARGGRLPPVPVRHLMKAMATVMTTTAYRI